MRRGNLPGSRLGLVVACATALSLFAATPSLAAPVHPFDESLSLEGFDRACGVAVDSEGDVFVASAGDSAIEIFNAAHDHLETIPNANDPCGLAVDGDGRLYVSESATGNVVRYAPSAYPFVGAPGYGSPAAIDSSGDAEGIAIDPVDDRLYVASGDAIDLYKPDGALFKSNELQHLSISGASGGTYKLSFEGELTSSLNWNATAAEVDAALEGLLAVGAGNVVVSVKFLPTDVIGLDVEFVGALAATDAAALEVDSSGLTGKGKVVTIRSGFNGHIGAGELTDAAGVGVHSAPPTEEAGSIYLFVTDSATDEIDLFRGLAAPGGARQFTRHPELFRTIDDVDVDGEPGTPAEPLDFGPSGAAIAADPGTCPPVDQSCTAGHFFVYDDGRATVEEFEASGQYVTQVASPDPPFALVDAEPTGFGIDRSGGANNGTLYVSSGAGAGARVLAFGPLIAPSHSALPELTLPINKACGTAVDGDGNVYVAGENTIRVFDPTSPTPATPIATISEPEEPCALAVDSEGNLYARYVFDGGHASSGDVVRYAPSSYPPTSGTTYSAPVKVDDDGESISIAVNPANDHLLVGKSGLFLGALFYEISEYDSAVNENTLLLDEIGKGILDRPTGINVDADTGNLYVFNDTSLGDYRRVVLVLNSTGTEVIDAITGAGSPDGTFFSDVSTVEGIAVDQRTGHVFIADPAKRGTVEEFEESGTFVGVVGTFPKTLRPSAVSIDQSGGPNDGNVYVAFFQNLYAFGPLSYGEIPVVDTGLATEVGGGAATLKGTVDPRGFPLDDCHFELVEQSKVEELGDEDEDAWFPLGTSAPCEPDIGGIGDGIGPVEVKADVAGLDPDERYYFRLVAENEFGSSHGKAGIFGPPVAVTEAANPVLVTEATLHALVDPAGLPTEYHFEYGPTESYGTTTAVVEVSAEAGPASVALPLFGLDEASEYHFRVVAENEAGEVPGADETLETQPRPVPEACPNAELRVGASSALPDCRAYELVSPADTNSFDLTMGETTRFNDTPITSSGDSVAFFTFGTLPGADGNGIVDGYRATRSDDGWSTELFGPSAAQAKVAGQRGVSPDHGYSFWRLFDGSFTSGIYLRTPTGFEAVGQGSLGTDLDAEGRFISAGAQHVIFSSGKQLEPDAPSSVPFDPFKGTVYDRSPGGPTRVVSLLPGDVPPPAGSVIGYQGSSEDGSTVAFKVGDALYARLDNAETIEIDAGPNSFAGISSDGTRLFYSDVGSGTTPGRLFAVDLGVGETEIAPNARFVNVSADGSHVYFTSTDQLDGDGDGIPGEDNLYVWDGSSIELVALLDPKDLEEFGGKGIFNLLGWIVAIGPTVNGIEGRAQSPTRSTPDGKVLIFQSHANLTGYDSSGHAEIYRYDTVAASLLCVSCNPAGLPATADAELQNIGEVQPIARTTLIPNVTDDGDAVFFQSADALVPGDANSVRDVYEWSAEGDGCGIEGGCLSLISSGQGATDNLLFGMTSDGNDVLFLTLEKLVGTDIAGSPSIYDARVGGGFPEPRPSIPCEGDACQGQGSTAPSLQAPASADYFGPGNLRKPSGRKPPRCGKGRRLVRRHGRARCVKASQGKKPSRRRGRPHGRSAR